MSKTNLGALTTAPQMGVCRAMKLIEALEVLRRPVSDGAQKFNVFLACGFTPLHAQTFLAAQLRTHLPKHDVVIRTGLFGDLVGNIERLVPSDFNSLVVIIEWADLDPRLGIRALGGWRPGSLGEVCESANQAATRLDALLKKIAQFVPTVVCMPTLPLPPMFWTMPAQASTLEMQLHQTVASLASSLSNQTGTRVVNEQLLGDASPLSGRFDVKSDLANGFPYSLGHASVVGGMLAILVAGHPPKKGLITDLDDTLWGGILGEDGEDGVSWDLEHHTQMHGLYQQFVASLAGAGILVGVASKNDPAAVDRAFARKDLLISGKEIFPFEVHWSRKSESIRRILDTWNIGADSVVFIDDSPMEIAEVKAAHPEIECIVFPGNDDQAIWNLLKRLRSIFGKQYLTEDDSLRLDSIRSADAWRDAADSRANSADEFLRAAEASIIFECAKQRGDVRAFELVNKTNQFNLNGRRFSESEWLHFFDDPATFLVDVSYKDKFGSLGKIAVIMGNVIDRTVQVVAWVLCCSAFSRRFVHQCLNYLFESFGADEIVFGYKPTPRNGPLQEFLKEFSAGAPVPGTHLSKELFRTNAPALFHHVEGTISV